MDNGEPYTHPQPPTGWSGNRVGGQPNALPTTSQLYHHPQVPSQSTPAHPNSLSPLRDFPPRFQVPGRYRGRHRHPRQLPSQTEEIISLNRLLGRGPNRTILYDVRRLVESAVCLREGLTDNDWAWRQERASTPGIESLTIRASFMGDMPIVVFPSQFPMVCVQDVLQAVHYAALRRLQEWGSDPVGLGLDNGVWNRVVDGERSALSSSSNFRWQWAGLTPSATERDVWILLLQ